MGHHPDSDADPDADFDPEFDADDADASDDTGGSLAARIRRVRDAGDRRAAAGLVELLQTGELDVRAIDALCSALIDLEELRVVPDLERLLADRTQAPARREAALEVLAGLPREDPPPERVRAWARAPDPVLRAHGATFLDAPDGALLAALIRDPQAVVRRAAARSLVGLARTPALVAATRAALHDEDPLVREWGCQAAYMDEPLPVLFDVLRLLRDPDDLVRRAAFDAAGEYPTVSSVLALADLRSPPVGSDEAALCDADAAEEMLLDLLPRVARSFAEWTGSEARLTRWFGPAQWVLDAYAPRTVTLPADAAGSAPAGAGSDARPAVRLAQARRVLCDPDAPARAQRELLAGRDWSATGAAGLALLVEVAPSLAGYRTRRAFGAALADLAGAGEQGALHRLRELAVDADSAVRHGALSALLQLRDDGAVAAAQSTLASPRQRPLAGDTAVSVIAALAPADVAERTLLAELERSDDVDGLLLGVIHQIERLGLTAAEPGLIALSEAPVIAGVGVHVTSLRALRALGCGRTPHVAHLLDIDHLHVQRELGAWRVQGGRFG